MHKHATIPFSADVSVIFFKWGWMTMGSYWAVTGNSEPLMYMVWCLRDRRTSLLLWLIYISSAQPVQVRRWQVTHKSSQVLLLQLKQIFFYELQEERAFSTRVESERTRQTMKIISNSTWDGMPLLKALRHRWWLCIPTTLWQKG